MAPSGWAIDTIGELCDVATGGTPSRGRGDFWGGDIPWMSSGEIHQRRVTHTKEAITAAGLAASNARWMPKNAVMIALNGQGKTRGTVAILKRPMTCNQSLAAILPNGSRLLPGYLLHYLSAKYTAIRQLTGDGGRNGLNLKHIRSIRVAYPALPEQHKIAAILSSVDDAIEKTQAVIDQVQVVKRGLMQKLLTRGLPGRHTRFKQTEIGAVPEEWGVAQTMEILSAKPRNGSSPRARATPPGVPTFSIAAVRDGRIDVFGNLKYVSIADRDTELYRLRHGDVLVVRGNANAELLGRCGIVDQFPPGSIYPDLLMKLTPNESMDPRYLAHLWNSDIVHDQLLIRAKTTSGTLKINQHDVSTVLLPRPTLREQLEIVNVAEALDFAYTTNCEVLSAYRHIKGSLMSILLTGELRVTPDPEPA